MDFNGYAERIKHGPDHFFVSAYISENQTEIAEMVGAFPVKAPDFPGNHFYFPAHARGFKNMHGRLTAQAAIGSLVRQSRAISPGQLRLAAIGSLIRQSRAAGPGKERS